MEPYKQLECEFATWMGTTAELCVACSSGTAALHLALEALPLRRDWEVMVPDYTMVACARAVVLAGLKLYFVGCDERLLICMQGVPAAKVVMPVHVYGRRCDMNAVHQWAFRHTAMVVEDMAEIHGVRPDPRSHAACWSFYANKIVGGEEGGMVWFKHRNHAQRARSLRCLGFNSRHDFTHVPRGHNYRLANSLAELILESLHDFDENVFLRRQAEACYDSLVPAEWRMPPRDAPWVYDLRIPGLVRHKQALIVRRLQEAGVEARHGFRPMTDQVEFRCSQSQTTEATMAAYHEVFYLPLTPDTADVACTAAVSTLMDIAEEVGIEVPPPVGP